VEFTVYCHEITSGSDVGLHFAATLDDAKTDLALYRDAFRTIDPTGELLGTLAIYEMVLCLPNFAMMIDLLNSPEALLRTCLKSRKLIAFTAE